MPIKTPLRRPPPELMAIVLLSGVALGAAALDGLVVRARVSAVETRMAQAGQFDSPLAIPEEIGADRAEATLTIAVIIPNAIRSGTPRGELPEVSRLTPAAQARYVRVIRDAAADLASWSAGQVRPRFINRVYQGTFDVEDDSRGGLWPTVAEVTAASATLFGDLQPDVLLILWPNDYAISKTAGLATVRRSFGGELPYISIPGPSSRVDDQEHPGEVVVHELGHALETISSAGGESRPSLHHPERYGFTADRAGSWSAWYRFFLTHPTVELAARANRAPLPVATRAPSPLIDLWRWRTLRTPGT